MKHKPDEVRLRVMMGLVVTLLWAFGLWGTRLNEPFVGRHDNNSAWISIAGQNYLRFGYFTIGLAQVMDVDMQAEAPQYYYQHHPPMPSVLASFSIALFGSHEASARLVTMFLTLIAASALFRVVRAIYGASVALLTSILFLTTPMVAFYGQMLNHEPLVTAFFLLALAAYIHYLRSPQTSSVILFVFSIAMMTLSGWAALFFVATLGLHTLLWGIHRLRLLFLLIVTTAIAELFWILLSIIYVPGFWHSLISAFFVRSVFTSSQLWNGVFDFVWRFWWGSMRIRFTEALFVFAAIGATRLVLGWRKHSTSQQRFEALVVLLILPGLLQIVVFMQQTFVHDYTTYFFAPVLALSSALGIIWLWSQRHWRYRGALVILVAGFVLSDIRWTRALYLERDDFPILIAPEIQKRVAEGHILYTNLPAWPAVWYYSQRHLGNHTQLAGEVSPGDAIMLCEINSAELPIGDVVRIERYICKFTSPGS